MFDKLCPLDPLPFLAARVRLDPAALLRQKRRMPHKSTDNAIYEAKPTAT
jgi:hypothetical protein